MDSMVSKLQQRPVPSYGCLGTCKACGRHRQVRPCAVAERHDQSWCMCEKCLRGGSPSISRIADEEDQPAWPEYSVAAGNDQPVAAEQQRPRPYRGCLGTCRVCFRHNSVRPCALGAGHNRNHCICERCIRVGPGNSDQPVAADNNDHWSEVPHPNGEHAGSGATEASLEIIEG